MALQGISLLWLPIGGSARARSHDLGAADGPRGAGQRQRDQLRRRPGRAGGRHHRRLAPPRSSSTAYLLSVAVRRRARDPVGAGLGACWSGMCVGLPAAQLVPGAAVHGRHRLDADRLPDGGQRHHPDRQGRPERAGGHDACCRRCCRSWSRWPCWRCPLIDLVLAVVRRTRAGRSPFAPDKQHLHHRLLEMGHSQRRAVLLLPAGPRSSRSRRCCWRSSRCATPCSPARSARSCWPSASSGPRWRPLAARRTPTDLPARGTRTLVVPRTAPRSITMPAQTPVPQDPTDAVAAPAPPAAVRARSCCR